jgi:hypothetical protein
MYYTPQCKVFLDNPLEKNLMEEKQASLEDGSHHLHKYELTQKEINKIFDREIYHKVIKSKAFQRLKKIHFLGAIDYILDPKGSKPNTKHTRYQHSLGVAKLALQFSSNKGFSKNEEILHVVSALLHDIGHAPLSHSMEPVFKDKFQMCHHLASERIIMGEAEIGVDLQKILLKWNINPVEVLEIINGTSNKKHKEIFGYSINIDTIEAILRSSTYLYQNMIYATPSGILDALLERGNESTAILDKFWLFKDEVYNKLINNKLGILADFICQKLILENVRHFDGDFYYKTENDLKKSHPVIFEKLMRISISRPSELLPGTKQIPFSRRSFYVNDSVELNGVACLNKRYVQNRISCTYDLNGDSINEYK